MILTKGNKIKKEGDPETYLILSIGANTSSIKNAKGGPVISISNKAIEDSYTYEGTIYKT